MLRREHGILVSRLVGFDDVEDRHYSVIVTLDLMPGFSYELTFFLEEYDAQEDSHSRYWQASDVAKFISKQDRESIRKVVLGLVIDAVCMLMPERIYMCSRGDDPSERAMRKYFLIARAIEMCGYEVHMPDRYHAQRIWWMDRIGASTVEAAS